MTKMLRVDDDVHEIISEMARKEDRTLNAFLNRLFREMKAGRMNQGIVGLPDENTPTPKNTEYSKAREEKMEALRPLAAEMVESIKPILDAQNNSGATPQVSDLFRNDMAPEAGTSPLNNELVCCMNEMQPCKHWVWDVQTGEGYKNSLSGRLMEVE